MHAISNATTPAGSSRPSCALADAIERGRPFTIQVAGERMHIPAGVTFNIEHERSRSEEELEFQLRWRPEP